MGFLRAASFDCRDGFISLARDAHGFFIHDGPSTAGDQRNAVVLLSRGRHECTEINEPV